MVRALRLYTDLIAAYPPRVDLRCACTFLPLGTAGNENMLNPVTKAY
jgi:hypothetical protein